MRESLVISGKDIAKRKQSWTVCFRNKLYLIICKGFQSKKSDQKRLEKDLK